MGQAEIQEAARPSTQSDTLDSPDFSPCTSAIRLLADGRTAWLHDGSCMSRAPHVQFCESLRVRFPGATHRVITCKSAAEARAAVAVALRILRELGVELHPTKTRIVHVQHGFEFLGYKIKRGKRLRLPVGKIRSNARSGALYAYPREKSIRRFQDQVRQRTKRRVPMPTEELIETVNPLLRGWGEYYKRAHVRKLFNRLDRWIVRRIWSHRFKRWRNGGWKQLPTAALYREYGLVNLVGLIPSLVSRHS